MPREDSILVAHGALRERIQALVMAADQQDLRCAICLATSLSRASSAAKHLSGDVQDSTSSAHAREVVPDWRGRLTSLMTTVAKRRTDLGGTVRDRSSRQGALIGRRENAWSGASRCGPFRAPVS